MELHSTSHAGSDLYGTTLFNGRPGIAVDASKSGLVQTSYGLLDPSPSPDAALLGRNYGRGPRADHGQSAYHQGIWSRTIEGGSAASNKSPTLAASADPGGTAGAPSGRAIRNLLGSSASDRRYNLVVGSSARNILNHNTPGPIVGNINSPNSDRCHSSVRECRSKHCKKRLLFRSGSRNSQAVPALRRSGQPAIPRRDVQCIKQDQLLAC